MFSDGQYITNYILCTITTRNNTSMFSLCCYCTMFVGHIAVTLQAKCFRIYFPFRHLTHFAFNFRISTYTNIYTCALMVLLFCCVCFCQLSTFSGVWLHQSESSMRTRKQLRLWLTWTMQMASVSECINEILNISYVRGPQIRAP